MKLENKVLVNRRDVMLVLGLSPWEYRKLAGSGKLRTVMLPGCKRRKVVRDSVLKLAKDLKLEI